MFIVRFDAMMNDFENLMNDIIKFLNIEKTSQLDKKIKIINETQREFKSTHSYDLSDFGLTKNKIKKDCSLFYKTFF